jgi:hypothetical protein
MLLDFEDGCRDRDLAGGTAGRWRFSRAPADYARRLGVLAPVVALAPMHLAAFGPHAVSSILLTRL